MKKRLLAMLLCVATMLSLCTGFASAASGTIDGALGEVNITNGGYDMSYLAMNGSPKKQSYTYFNYTSPATGILKEIPAYCINPTTKGVPQTVGEGESIKYIANEAGNDPKVVGIIANGYPHRGLAELKLDNKHQAFYATKMALWCYLIDGWSIDRLTVNSSLSGVEKERGEKILAAAKDIYTRGIWWNTVPQPTITVTADKDAAYPVSVDGTEYQQQIFTVSSETWVCDYLIDVKFTMPDEVPAGTRIVNMENQDITAITTSATGSGYAGQFKVLYPADAVSGQSGAVQLSFHADVYRYAIYYALCAETDKYGNLQRYMCDTDPTTEMSQSTFSRYTASPTTPPPETPPTETTLIINKVETGTNTALSGALFEVKAPDGTVLGSFSTDNSGRIVLPLTLSGQYVITEKSAPRWHLLGTETTKTVSVTYGNTATVTFDNAPYGNLRVEKIDADSGDHLAGAKVEIKHIESGATYTGTTDLAGSAYFDHLKPGAYQVRELAAPSGWMMDSQTYTVNVVSGEEVGFVLKNQAKPGLTITKYDEQTKAPLPDVTFAVYRDTVLIGMFSTDELGQIRLVNLQPGTYLVKEVSTDAGYVLDSTPQQIELKAGDGILNLTFFNTVKPGIHITKVDSQTMQPLSNAQFRVSLVGGTFSKEYVTDQKGEIDLIGLTPGAYTVVELTAPNGYLLDDAARVIQINAGENARFVFTNTKKPTLSVVKYDGDNNKYLGGATFRIATIKDGSRYLDRVTDANGRIEITGMEPGIYSVQEIAAPSGYVLNDREYHVELFPGRDSQIVVNNEKKPDLLIVKTDAITGAPLSGVTFTVNKADSSTLTTVKTDANGEALLTALDPGVYVVTEKSVPSGYLLDETPQMITLVPNTTGTVRFQNYPKPTLTINKVDSITKDPIKGAKFHITYASNDTFTGEINDLGTFFTDENGQIQLSKLTDGWYRITEVEPAPGYAIKEPATQDSYIQAGTGKVLTFENTPLSALVVYKYDSVTGEAVGGAVFQVKYLGGTSGTGGTIIGTYKTSANGSFTVTGLAAGTYIVEELASDSGHVIDTAPQTAYLSGKDQDVVQLYFGNSPKGSLLIKKIDSVTHAPLSDVQFMITASDGTVIGNNNGKFTTDSAGSILISGLNPGTSVVVKETAAKDGYLLDDAPQTAKIIAGETVTLEFRNQPKGGLIINKLDSITHKPLSGVTFKITYADGGFVPDADGKLSSNGLYYTDKNGQIMLSGITGTLVVTEEKTIDGYAIDEDTRTQTVVVNPNDTQSLTFYNTPIGGGRIIKVDADSGERIKGVQFEVARMNGERVGVYTTDSTGVIILPELVGGWYTATEIKAAKGYLLDATPHNFEVKDGKTTSITVENTKASSILIHKVDGVTGKGIYGVTFLVSDAKGNPIGQYTSDQNGYVYIDKELTDGKYTVREIETAEGYILDTIARTFYVEYGATSEILWKNTPTMGQIQITKKSADDNPYNGLPAGTLLPGATFELYNRAGTLVDTVVSGSNGVAISRTLPLGRYTVRETKAPAFYSPTAQTVEAEIELSGQIIRLEVLNQSCYTNVSVTKRGYIQVVTGQTMRYDFKNIANNSTVSLSSFYWRDTLPTDAVRLQKIVTGTWNQRLSYKVVFKTNLNDYRTLADNLSTAKNNVLDASPVALGLASNEYVTEYMFVFGTVKAGFAQVDAPYIFCTVNGWLHGGYQFTNKTDVGGIWSGQWIMATDRWVTTVYGKTPSLPKTGF